MEGATLHHVGIAVASLAAGREAYAALGLVPVTAPVLDSGQQARLQLLGPRGAGQPEEGAVPPTCLAAPLRGASLIELVEPMAGSPLAASVLAKRDEAAYHHCFEVDSIEASLSAVPDARVVSSPRPAPLFGGRRVCFAFLPGPRTLVELLERTAAPRVHVAATFALQPLAGPLAWWCRQLQCRRLRRLGRG